MGNVVDTLVGRDGIITKVAEALPGGGLVTGVVHAAAGNAGHAVQAAISGYGTLAATALLGPPGAIGAGIAAGAASLRGVAAQHIVPQQPATPTIASIGESVAAIAGTEGVRRICDEIQITDPCLKNSILLDMERGEYSRASTLLLFAGEQKLKESTRALSAASGGKRCVKSAAFGAYLRAVEPDWRVDAVWRAPQAWENWYLEDWGGKVVLKGRGGPNKPGQFLRALPDGSVDLVGTHPKGWEMWKPFQNKDGTWSLLSAHGMWLSMRDDGTVTTVVQCRSWEHFVLEWW